MKVKYEPNRKTKRDRGLEQDLGIGIGWRRALYALCVDGFWL